MTGDQGPTFEPDVLAAELARAEANARPVELLSTRFPDLDFGGARQVALARDRLRRAEGDQQVGYKLGWTSAAMREALGIDRPNWGTLWRSQLRVAPIRVDRLIHPKLEPELVARIGASGQPVEWALGLEIVDPRFPSYELDWLDNTADNSSAAAVVVGGFSPVAEPARVQVRFDDGDESRVGSGSAAMGDPAVAVAWLADSLAQADLPPLAEGDIVFTGGLCAPFDLTAGSTYTVTSAAVGLAAVSVTAAAPG